MKKNYFLPTILSLAALTLFVSLPHNAFATDAKTAEIKASIPQTLALMLSDNALNLDLSDMTFHTDAITVTGSTNNPFGYMISFNVDNDYNDLKHSNPLVENKIPSITEDKTGADFLDTAWGFSLDATTFSQIPMETTNIFETATKGQNDHTFTVGAKTTADMVAGSYENELLFTIVANAGAEDAPGNCNPSAMNITNAVCMQDMNDNIKATMVTEQQYQLKDARDGKIYFVSKLRDGHVWMTQNLDYDLSVVANQTLVPETSNVTEERIVVLDDEYVIYSDGGDIYFENGDSVVGTAGYSSLAVNDENRHYHVGDLYSWRAATAGQGMPGRNNYIETDSICPAKWQLPLTITNSGDGSYEELLEKQGLADYGHGGDTSPVVQAPFYFILGEKSINDDSILYYGRYWGSQVFAVSSVVRIFSVEGYDNGNGRIEFENRDYGGLYNSATSNNSGNYVRCVSL